jgi:hypothetical protein
MAMFTKLIRWFKQDNSIGYWEDGGGWGPTYYYDMNKPPRFCSVCGEQLKIAVSDYEKFDEFTGEPEVITRYLNCDECGKTIRLAHKLTKEEITFWRQNEKSS